VNFEELYASTTASGEPTHYALFGNFIYLRPKPNYNETNGLRVFGDRNPLYMLTTDTIKEPGVPKKHQMYLCRKAALPFLIAKKLPQMPSVAALIQKDEEDIKRFYARRDKTKVARLIPKIDSNK
jgi:hypothetical protein